MNYIYLLIASILGGILYRMGGSGHYSRLSRILGVPGVIVTLFGIVHFSWWTLLCFPLLAGAFSSYWTIVSKPDSDGTNREWWLNYFLHDLGVVLAMLPYVIVTHKWLPFVLTIGIAPFIVATYSYFDTKSVREELIRGGLMVLTLGLLI